MKKMQNKELARPPSLALRLTIFIGIATTLVFMGFGFFIERSIQQHFVEQDASEMRTVAKMVAQELKNTTNTESLQDKLTAIVSGHQGVFWAVIEGQQVIFSTHDLNWNQAITSIKPSETFEISNLQTWKESQESFRIIRLNIPTVTSAEPTTLMVATAIDFHLHYMKDLRHSLWIATFMAAFFVILVARYAVYQGHSPLRKISTQIKNITSKHLDIRLSPQNVPQELSELVSSFNVMMERMEDVFQRQANFSADIAHEMRTPVTNLSTQTEIALSQERSNDEYKEILYSSLEEYSRMGKMISDMLFLAQADNNLLTPEWGEVDLSKEVQTLFEFFEPMAEEREITLNLEEETLITIQGDRLMLCRALSNLISNAIRYTPSGELVTVSMKEVKDFLYIHIINSGSVIPAEHLPRLFDRFYRVDASRQRKGDGAGIGLAIVKSIITAHGGTITVTSENAKTQFSIVLPIMKKSII